jgi:hypothetical protein
MKVALTLGHSIQAGTPQPLFDLQTPTADGATVYARSSNAQSRYDVLPDGRLVMIRSVEQPARQIVIVQNWADEMKRLLGTR